MSNISEVVQQAAEILEQNGVLQPRNEAKSLLCLAIERDKTFLIAHFEYELTADEARTFGQFVERRAKREPFQHIAEKQEFYGLDFVVSKDVLIPRPETELIVENAIEILSILDRPQFCEVGIGSGCIAVSILHNVENSTAIGLDVSEKALSVAKRNAENIGVSARMHLEVSDVFNVLTDEKFDLIVSNPPYIAEKDLDTLQKEVRDFDPHIALTDGKDGLSIIKEIVDKSPEHLFSKGYLLMEIGIDQSYEVLKMFAGNIWQDVSFINDLQGIPRMVKARIY